MGIFENPQSIGNEYRVTLDPAERDDYTNNPDPEAILRDPRFLQDLREQYGNNLDDDDLIDKFYSDQIWGDLNTLSAAKDAVEATTAGEAERSRLRRLQKAYRSQPWFWNSDERSAGETAIDAAAAIFSDPINFVPGLNALSKARIAGRTAQVAGQNALRSGIKEGAKTGAKSEALISGGQEAAVNTSQQVRDVQLGLQEEFSTGRLAGATAFGAGIGGGVGGLIGGTAGAFGGRQGARQADQLAELGYTPEQISTLAPEEVEAIISRGTASRVEGQEGTPQESESQEGQAEGEQEGEQEETPEQAIDREFADVDRVLDANISAYRKDIDDLQMSGADEALIKDTRQRLQAVAQLRGMVERLKKERDEIAALGETNDVRSLSQRDRRLSRFEDDFSRLRVLMAQTDSDEDADAILERIRAMREEMNAESPDGTPESETDSPQPEQGADPETGSGDAPEAPEAPEADTEAAEPAQPEAETQNEPIRYASDGQRERIIGLLEKEGLNESDLQAFLASGRVEYGRSGRLIQRSERQIKKVLRDVRAARVEETAETGGQPEATPQAEAAPAEPEVDAAPEKNLPAPSDVKISTRQRGRALADGVDYRRLDGKSKSKSGAVTKGVITEEVRRKARSQEAQDAYAEKAQEELSRIIDEVGILEADDAVVRQFIEIASRDSSRGWETDPQDMLALFDEIKKRSDAEDSVDNASRSNIDGETKTFQQKVLRRKREIRKNNPDLSDEAADTIARGEIQSGEAQATTGGDTIRNTGRRTEEAGNLTQAGRTNTGRIQSFLRRGTRIGRDSEYTVTGGNQVRPSEFGFEAALIKARQGNGITPFQTTGRTKVMTREEGTKNFGKGETAYADPMTGRAYESRELAMEVRGDGPQKSKDRTPTQEQTPEDTEARIRDLMAEYARSGDSSGFMDAVAAIRRGEAIDTKRANDNGDTPEPQVARPVDTETVAPEAIPLTRGDKLLIVRSKTDPSDVRMMSPRQADEGGDIRRIIGSKGPKSDPANWEARYAPRQSAVRGRGARQRLFNQLEQTDTGETPQPGGLYESGDATGAGRPLNVDDLRDYRITDVTEDEGMAIRLSHSKFSRDPENKDYTLADFYLAARATESKRWEPTLELHREKSERLRILYERIQSEAPQGFTLNATSRDESIASVRSLFSGLNTEEVRAAEDLLTRLGGNPNRAPEFIDGEGKNSLRISGTQDGRISEAIRLTPDETSITPSLATLYHEVAHWAYFNILTPKDRADFWRSAERYYKESGSLDRDAIDEAVPKPGRQTFRDENGGTNVLRSNSMESPQELFANQFELWAMRGQAPEIMKDESFWRQITRYVKAVFDRFYHGAKIDADLEPLFAKILPPEEAQKVRLGVDSQPSSEFGRHIQKRYVELQQLQRDIDDAFNRDSADAIITAHGELVRYLLSTAPRGSTEERPNTGVFDPFKRYIRLINQRVDDINEIVSGKPFASEDGAGDLSRTPPEWVDMGAIEVEDPQAVADMLRDYYHNGYAGQFTPERGLPARIKQPEGASVSRLVRNLQTAMEASYRRKESGNMVPGHRPEVTESAGSQAEPPSKEVRAEKKKQTRKKEAASREARKTAKTPPAKRASRAAVKTDPAVAEELKTKSLDDLRSLYMKHRGTKRGDQIAIQMLRKEKAAPLPSKKVAITPEIRNMGGSDLQSALLEALTGSDSNQIDRLSFELRRREANKKRKKTGEKLIQPVFSQTNRSILQEQADDIGLATNDAVPPSARASVRELLSYMTHRDPEVEQTLRTMTYRMVNLMGKAARGTIQDSNVMTSSDIAQLAGVDPTSVGNAVFADMRAPEFKTLRRDMRRMAIGLTKGNVSPFDVMHEIGHVVARSGILGEREIDAIRQSYRFANDSTKKRVEAAYGPKYQNRITATKEDLLAEEWFAEQLAQYMGERVAKGDIHRAAVDGDVGDLTLRSSFGRAIDRAVEYVAYVVNGMIGRNDIKQQFRRLLFYGDMHERPRQSPVSISRIQSPAMSPIEAPDAVMDSIMSSPAARLQKIKAYVGDGLSYDAESDSFVPYYHGTPRGDKLRRDANPDAVLRVSDQGNFGPGVYLADNPEVANQVYSRRPTQRAFESQIDELDLPQEKKNELVLDAATLNQVRRQIADGRANYGQAKAEGKPDMVLETMRTIMDEAVDQEQAIVKRLAAAGVEPDPLVMPLYTRVRNPADFRETARFDSIDDPLIRSMLDYMNMVEIINNDGYRALVRTFSDGPKDGAQTYKALVNVLERSGRSQVQAKTEINEMLDDMGYDGLLATHRNSVDTTDADVMANGNTYEPSQKVYDGLVVFDSRNVKHIEAAEFDAADERLYYRDSAGLPKGEVGAVVDSIINENVENIESINPGRFGESLETRGATPSLTSAVMSKMRGRRLDTKEEQSMRKQSPFWFLQSQSSRMRDLGARWVADWYKGHFPDLHNQFAKKYMPIHHALRALPDADGKVRAWARESTGSIKQEQPKSYGRIVRALRRGDGSRQEKALSSQEREVYQSIRRYMVNERNEMMRLGIHVGDRGPNYMPQVWRPERIRKNRDQFLAGMEQYYFMEKASRGQEASSDEAKDFALGIYERLAGNEADGTFVPVRGGSRSPRFENVDYSRVVELEKHPEAMEMLEGFLEDDIESLLVKYMEGSTRKISHAEKFGVNNHGFYDYLMTAEQGADGIARLLSNNKVFRRDTRAITEDGYVVEPTVTETAPMPFEGDQGRARSFVKELVAAHQEKGTAAARQMLEEIAPKTTEGLRSETYARRVDSILGALDDFKGKPSDLEQKDFAFLESSMDIAMKKPLLGTGGEGVRNFSKFMRSFNNISLLGFTTLTSLGDVALPMIRSGSMQSWSKAVKQYAQDPDYRRMLENVGVAMESIVHERMIYMYGAVDNKLSNSFFNATMLTPWTDMNRRIAGAVGHETFKTMQTKAVKNHKANQPIANQNRAYKEAARFLNRYGLGEYLPTGSKARESLSNRKLLETDDQVRLGILKFADDAIFVPNPNDVPMWAQTPWGALIFQLKSFPLMMARMGRDLVKEARDGNIRPLLYLATLGPAFGSGALATKDIVQMRGGDDGRDAELRERNLTNVLESMGYNADIHGSKDEFLGWYVDGMMQMGGLGLIGDVIYNVATQVDNGSYGEVRVTSTFAGPSYGAAISGVKIGAGLLDSNDDSNAKERAAAREAATRIPVLGGLRSVREGIVDNVAGESSRDSGGGGFTSSLQ